MDEVEYNFRYLDDEVNFEEVVWTRISFSMLDVGDMEEVG